MQDRTPLPIEFSQEALAAFCATWRIAELSLFGSVLRDDFGPQSDVDVLVRFAPNARWSLIDLVRAEEQLSELIGRKVDMVDRESVEASHNWIRRRAILETARRIYVPAS